MELLREFYALCPNGYCEDLLTEDEKKMVTGGNALFLTGVVQRADATNGNGRIYPYEVLAKEIESYQKLVKESRAVGELDHPDAEEVRMAHVSHLITKLWWEGKDVMAKLKVLTTPNGNILRQLIKDGVQLGISSRGMGSVREEGYKTYVEDNYRLVCFDIVHEPSTNGAFVKPSRLSEGLNRKSFSKADRINRLLVEISNR